ncbi:TPA: hypothetical protein DCZ31_01245, partial [Patescibacteria group bacterium]|nr:hypothetical protein [Candidatus Gracilibacteria bacterium]
GALFWFRATSHSFEDLSHSFLTLIEFFFGAVAVRASYFLIFAVIKNFAFTSASNTLCKVLSSAMANFTTWNVFHGFLSFF